MGTPTAAKLAKRRLPGGVALAVNNGSTDAHPRCLCWPPGFHFLNGILTKRTGIEVAKLNALKQDAGKGWAAVSAGRHSDLEDEELEALFGKLGLPGSATVGILIGKPPELP